MLTITISGPPKSGKSMVVNLFVQVLRDLVGVAVEVDDAEKEEQGRVTTISGIGRLLRKMHALNPVRIQTLTLRPEDSLAVMRADYPEGD